MLRQTEIVSPDSNSFESVRDLRSK